MKLTLQFSLTLVFLGYVYVGCHGRKRQVHPSVGVSQCPRITVEKKTIIRTRSSIDSGARLLHKDFVRTARECYSMCCNRKDCDTGVMRYTHGNPRKICYLFSCGFPTRCTFVPHNSYAIIHFMDTQWEKDTETDENGNRKDASTETSGAVTPTETPDYHKGRLPEEKCPPGSPVAMCSEDPCSVASCDAFPKARCQPSYCGGCSAHFYNEEMERVVCDKIDVRPKTGVNKDEEKSSGEGENATSSKKTKTKTKWGVKVNEDVVVVSPEDGGGLPTDETTANGEDPYFQTDRREWLDGPKKGEKRHTLPPTTQVTTKYFFANFTGPEKKLGPENGVPTVRPKNATHTVPFSVPLLIAMLVCVVVLTAVVWKMRCNKIGKKGKKFAVDDGDYLINGMYL